MPGPDSREGSALPGFNFVGPGWNGPFRTRPRNAFDFAAKIHDLTYCLNGLSGGWGNTESASELSKKSKADRLFRLLTSAHTGGNLLSRLLHPLTEATFLGGDESDFRRGDGFVNPLVDQTVVAALSAPQRYLMIPYDGLPGRPCTSSGADYLAATPFDFAPGWFNWTRVAYQAVWPALVLITSNRGQ
jgi:hypothetical protein